MKVFRKIIKIDRDKCNGCGACASACHEGAIEIIDGKATLTREDFCDGFGDCLPECAAGAISFELREAPEYDEHAVAASKEAKKSAAASVTGASNRADTESQLKQWPCQIKLVPPMAPFFRGASILVAADCTAYAYANFHADFMCGKVTLIGCPKLDGIDYGEKLAEIFAKNEISDVTVLRMTVPCCGGLEHAVVRAIEKCRRPIPLRVVMISTDGKVFSDVSGVSK